MLDRTDTTYKIDWRIINWLRGLAAFYVVVNHSRGFLFTDTASYSANVNPQSNWAFWEWLQVRIMQFTNLGSEFVVFFFLLSGFSIAHSLRSNNDTKEFYKRRLLRLYPTYVLGIVWAIIAFVIISIFASPVFYAGVEGQEPLLRYYHYFIDLKALLLNLIYIPTDNYLTHQYWSLPHEVIFYLLAPWVIKKYRWMGIVALSWYLIGWAFSGISQNEPDSSPIFLQFTSDYAIYFFIGILFYRYKDRLISSFRLNKTATIVLGIVLFMSVSLMKGYVFHQVQNKVTGLGITLLAYVLLFGAMKNNIRIKPLERIGEYSYTLYVTHIATIFVLKTITYKMGYGFHLIDNMLIWYFGIFFSVFMAWGLYRVAEQPSTAYVSKMRLRKKNTDGKSVNSIEDAIHTGFSGKQPSTANMDPFSGENGKLP
ncbi:MAG: acyltransferase [Chitinophagales bacterium]|nr:acyltransferase [Chitinophagaceae bacterium]MCB9064247.1 acyltransferase [Chitinophagales bacterium]